jgi:hypothetical protein
MSLPMADMPAAISDSIAVTLKAHGLSLSPDVLRELGTNTAEMLAVAETLRSLAHAGRPNHETAVALARVGNWLADAARAELAAKGRSA